MIPALAFCDFDAVRRLPQPKRNTEHLLDLSNHIRQRRMELQMSRDDLAQLLDVTKDTVVYWETKQIAPNIMQLPKILAFLGYNPFEDETGTLGGKIKEYRYRNGLSQRKLASLLAVSVSAIKSWEENAFKPTSEHQERLKELLGI